MSFKGKKKRIVIGFLLLVYLAGIIFIIFNENGLIKYLRLKNEINQLSEQISSIEKENRSLQAEIDSLQQKIPAKIEKVAREKYDLLRKGEKKVEVIEK